MKQKHLIIFAFLMCLFFFEGRGQVTYSGNGNSGFGGVFGNGDITISDNGNDITVTFNRGTSDFNDFIVIFLDTSTGGITSTAPIVDFGDPHRKAITTNNVTFNFPPGFSANRSIVLNRQFGAIWDVTQNFNNLNIEGTGLVFDNDRLNNLPSYTMTFDKSVFGFDVADDIEFSLLAYYLNPTGGDFTNGFVSNEGIGRGLPGSNIGGTEGTIATFETYFTYPDNLQGGVAKTDNLGNFNVVSTWENGNLPFQTDNLIIAHNVTLNLDVTVANITINSGQTLTFEDTQERELTILNGGNLNNNGSIIANDGTLIFSGSGNISGAATTNLHNLEINGGVNVGSSSTVANECVIKSGSFFTENAPRFLENSTLIYHTGGNYNRGIEWNNSTTSTQGTPHNVEIRSSDFQMDGESFSSGDATIAGDLIITGGSFNMDRFIHSDVEANNIIVNGGDIVIGDTSFGDPVQGRALVANGDFRNLVGNVTLGTGYQGDLKVRGGNFEYLTTNSTFDSKGRAIIFDGSQNITTTSTGAIIIDFMVIDMPSGKVIIDNDLTIQGLSGTGGESGILLEMKNEATLDLNSHDLVLGGGVGVTQAFDVSMSNNTKIISTPSTEITILNNGDTQLRLDESEQGVTNAVKKLIVNNEGKTIISNDLHIFESLDVDEAEVDGNDKLIFRSSESQTAIISEVKNGGSVTGPIRTERFFKMGNRAFRYVSPSVTSTATINAQWQEGQNNSNTATNSNTNPGFGTHITGSLNGSNGFDATETGNPSLFIWDAVEQKWVSVSNTDDTTLNAGEPLSIMIRGDRSADLSNNNSTGASTILRSIGVPIFGDTIYNSNVAIDEFVLIGNPYQAQVDLTKVETSGFTNDFYIWDASMGTFGGYALFDGTSTTPDSGTDVNQFLQVNQAFFKKASATSQSVTFRETHKHDGINNNVTLSSPEFTRINVNLLRNGDLVVDGLRIDFDENYDDEVNLQDATKLWNLQEYFAIDKNPNWLMVEKRTIPENESIQLYLDNYFSSEYSLSLNVQNLNTHKAFLYDAYLDKSTELTNNQINTYAFEVDSNIQETQGPHRFSLHFEVISLTTHSLNDILFDVFPNPASELVNLKFPLAMQGEKANFQLVDMLGKVVFQQMNNLIEETHLLELPKRIPRGIYMLNVTTEKRSISTKIIIK